jgi:hypothetical protein
MRVKSKVEVIAVRFEAWLPDGGRTLLFAYRNGDNVDIKDLHDNEIGTFPLGVFHSFKLEEDDE